MSQEAKNRASDAADSPTAEPASGHEPGLSPREFDLERELRLLHMKVDVRKER